MRKLVVQQWVTVDNYAAEEDGGLGFVSGEPFSERSDPAFTSEIMGFIDSVDTMLLGAGTYDQAKGYWPHAADQGEYGEKVNGLTRFVASSTLAEAPWGDFPAGTVTSDPVATVRELKALPGKDIWLWGSLTLMQSLLGAGVVDEVRMLVCPVALGRGRPLFEGPRDLTLVEATAYGNGLALQRYGVRG